MARAVVPYPGGLAPSNNNIIQAAMRMIDTLTANRWASLISPNAQNVCQYTSGNITLRLDNQGPANTPGHPSCRNIQIQIGAISYGIVFLDTNATFNGSIRDLKFSLIDSMENPPKCYVVN